MLCKDGISSSISSLMYDPSSPGRFLKSSSSSPSKVYYSLNFFSRFNFFLWSYFYFSSSLMTLVIGESSTLTTFMQVISFWLASFTLLIKCWLSPLWVSDSNPPNLVSLLRSYFLISWDSITLTVLKHLSILKRYAPYWAAMKLLPLDCISKLSISLSSSVEGSKPPRMTWWSETNLDPKSIAWLMASTDS